MITTPDPTMPVVAYLYPRGHGSGVGFVRPANYVDGNGAVVQADDLILKRDAEAALAALRERLEGAEKLLVSVREANNPLTALSIHFLVAAGFVTQEKADEAFRLACDLAAREKRIGEPPSATQRDALRFGADVAETLLKIGRAIGFGRAQQILGEQWEADHDCAPRGRMGVTVKDAASKGAAA